MMSFWVVPWSAARSTPFSSADGHVERQQPGGGGVDRHRRVHLVERDAVEQRVHVALVGDRHADLAHLARATARGRGRSRSGWAGRRRSRARSGPWPGSCGRARSTPSRSNGPRRCASPTGGRARVDGGLTTGIVWSRADEQGHRRRASGPRARDLRLRALAGPDRGSGPRVLPSTRCWRAWRASRARCCSPTSTSTTPGATGVLARRFPDLTVYVHERGAPHLIDPLQAAQERRAPVRRPHGRAVGRGRAGRSRAHPGAVRRRDASRASAWPTRPGTPPTTSATSTSDTGDAYVGDMAGVRLPPTTTRWRPRRRRTSTWRRGSARST